MLAKIGVKSLANSRYVPVFKISNVLKIASKNDTDYS